MTRASRPRLVVLRALGLGDYLTAVPALRALGRALPEHERVLLAPGWLAPLAEASGAVDTLLHTDFLATPPAAAAIPRAAARPDVAVNLHGRGPESHRALMALGPRCLMAFGQRGCPVPGPAWNPSVHEVDRWCTLLAWHGIEADPTDLRLAIEPDRPAVLGPDRPVVLHPGAASAARRWPAQRWVAVARALRVVGRSVVLTGGPHERPLAEAIAERAGLPRSHVLAGRTPLLALARLIAGARALVSADTGPAHLATAVGTRSVVLFGPTPPSCWGARIDRQHHVELWRGRTGDPHGDTVDPGLLAISPADVLDALRGVPA